MSQKYKFNPIEDTFDLVQDVSDIEYNIVVNAFRIAINGSLTRKNMIDSFVDEFEDESGIDNVNSINEAYDDVGDYYSPASSGGIDAYTKLMLHCNGTDGSTSFPDSSASAHTFTANYDAQVDTAQYKFGGASCLLDGTNDNLSISPHDDWRFGTADWTVDLWVRPNSIVDLGGIIGGHQERAWNLYMRSGGVLHFLYKYEGHNIFFTTTGTISSGSWQHIAIVRTNGNIYIYINGVLAGSSGDESADFDWSVLDADLYIGFNDANNVAFNGHIDEVRISKGIARWTGNFTPPTTEYTAPLASDMTLLSEPATASTQPDTGSLVLFEEDVDSITLNTDLKVYISRDGGTTWSQGTLENKGEYETGQNILVAEDVDLTGQPAGTSMDYKINTHNNKDLKLHGVGLLWD